MTTSQLIREALITRLVQTKNWSLQEVKGILGYARTTAIPNRVTSVQKLQQQLPPEQRSTCEAAFFYTFWCLLLQYEHLLEEKLAVNPDELSELLRQRREREKILAEIRCKRREAPAASRA